jgi:hypothetical protein
MDDINLPPAEVTFNKDTDYDEDVSDQENPSSTT